MKESTITGSCLCGKVAFQFSGPIKLFQYCHCSRCRKVTGSAHSANIIVDPEQFRWIQGEELIGRYEVPDAKHFATSFCTHCGSNLPWLAKTGKAIVIPAGALDEAPETKPFQNIFWVDRAKWYENVDHLPKYDRLPKKDRK